MIPRGSLEGVHETTGGPWALPWVSPKHDELGRQSSDLAFALLWLAQVCFRRNLSESSARSAPLATPAGRDTFRRGVWTMVVRALLEDDGPLSRDRSPVALFQTIITLVFRSKSLEGEVLARVRRRYNEMRPELFLESVSMEQLAFAEKQADSEFALAELASEERRRLVALGFDPERSDDVSLRGLAAFSKMVRHTTRELSLGILWRRHGPFAATLFATASAFVAATTIWLVRSEAVLPVLIREWMLFVFQLIESTFSS